MNEAFLLAKSEDGYGEKFWGLAWLRDQAS